MTFFRLIACRPRPRRHARRSDQLAQRNLQAPGGRLLSVPPGLGLPHCRGESGFVAAGLAWRGVEGQKQSQQACFRAAQGLICPPKRGSARSGGIGERA